MKNDWLIQSWKWNVHGDKIMQAIINYPVDNEYLIHDTCSPGRPASPFLPFSPGCP